MKQPNTIITLGANAFVPIEDYNNLQSDLSASRERERELEKAYKAAIDSAEFSWAVICNASGGEWKEQSKDWQEAAKLARETYYKALDSRPESDKPKNDDPEILNANERKD